MSAATSSQPGIALHSDRAHRLRTGLHPGPTPRSPTRRAHRRRLRSGVPGQGQRQTRPPRDQLVITKLDRLGRSLVNLIDLSGQLHTRGVDLVVLDQGIDTSTAAGRMFFQMLGSIAEFEGALASERTLDGLAAARRRGRIGGRKPKLGARQIRRGPARPLWQAPCTR